MLAPYTIVIEFDRNLLPENYIHTGFIQVIKKENWNQISHKNRHFKTYEKSSLIISKKVYFCEALPKE